MSVTKIDTVIFDVGNVLFHWDLRCLFEKLIDNREDLDWFLSTVVTPEWHFQHDAGRSFVEMVPERCAEFPDHAELIRAYAERWLETISGPVPGTQELVERLASKGRKLFIISNFGVDSWEMFRPTAPVFDHFEDAIISGREGLLKPDPAIYRLALARFDVAAENCLFIDDKPENVEAGKALGIAGHHFRDAVTLEKELTELGLI